MARSLDEVIELTEDLLRATQEASAQQPAPQVLVMKSGGRRGTTGAFDKNISSCSVGYAYLLLIRNRDHRRNRQSATRWIYQSDSDRR